MQDLNREFLAALAARWGPHVHYGALRDIDMRLCLALWLGPSMEFCRYGLLDADQKHLKQVKSQFADAAWLALRA